MRCCRDCHAEQCACGEQHGVERELRDRADECCLRRGVHGQRPPGRGVHVSLSTPALRATAGLRLRWTTLEQVAPFVLLGGRRRWAGHAWHEEDADGVVRPVSTLSSPGGRARGGYLGGRGLAVPSRGSLRYREGRQRRGGTLPSPPAREVRRCFGRVRGVCRLGKGGGLEQAGGRVRTTVASPLPLLPSEGHLQAAQFSPRTTTRPAGTPQAALPAATPRKVGNRQARGLRIHAADVHQRCRCAAPTGLAGRRLRPLLDVAYGPC